MSRELHAALALALIGLPLLGVPVAALARALPGAHGEALLRRATSALQTLAWVTSMGLVAAFYSGREASIPLHLGTWFSLEDYEFSLALLLDGASIPMAALTTTLASVVGRFSFRYLHREQGVFRFFLLLGLFEAGMLLLSLAGSLDVLVVGWELVGITSMLLIGFFTHRAEPRESALRAFVHYRLCDVGLLVAGVGLHHYAHSAEFDTSFGAVRWPLATAHLGPFAATAVAGALTLAAAGKSAQLPFSSWLPRAMEGPTPSGAIFYGALSVHAGAYLLLRAAPVLEEAPIVRVAVALLGAATALHATLVGRVQSDVKSSLTYASLTQVGVIFVEIGAGAYRLALAHMIGHAAVRSWQLLRAPSFLHDRRVVDEALGGEARPPGRHIEHALPERLRCWLYRLSVERFTLEVLLERWIVAPASSLAASLDEVEARIEAQLSARRRPAAPAPDGPAERVVPEHR